MIFSIIQKVAKAVLIVAFVIVSFIPNAPALAQTDKYNWMYEYVELRTNDRNLRELDRLGLSATVSDRPLSLTPRIVGGSIARPGDHEFQVALLRKAESNDFAAQFCGGTLYKPNIVVTAAHCSDFITPDQVQVLTGTRRLDGSGTRHDVSKITIHPDWHNVTFDNDVAVWELSDNATGIPLATLATSDGPVGGDLLATGWGALTQGGSSPIDLQKVTVPLVERANCNDANSYNGEITENMLCAGFDEGRKDSCQGDSGGPLTKDNNVLTGITSWGRGCAQPNLFGVYTRVSNEGIRSFIEQNSGNITSRFEQPQLLLNNFANGAGGWSSFDLYPRTAGDVNGDGKTDIVGFGEAGVYVSFSNGSGFEQPQLLLNNFANGAGGWSSFDLYPRTVGDVNGDGKADIVGFGEAGVYVSFSNGSRFEQPQLLFNNATE